MSDVQIVLSAYPRVQFACRTRHLVVDEGSSALSEHQLRILSHLDPVDPAMVTELAEHMGVTASTMSLNLKRLQEAGFVQRERDPQDRRVMNVRLTELGARARAAHSVLDEARVDAMLSTLRPEDRRRAVDGLAILADAADALVARRHDHVGAPAQWIDR